MQQLRIIIAPDKFKGTLTASEAASAIARGWTAARPHDHLEKLPIADGGDGFGEALSRIMRARRRFSPALDAAHQPCKSAWWWHATSRTAVIESAQVIGLAMLPRGHFHPYELDTFGLGLLLKTLREAGARRLLIGIGGSATNDGGFGLARALGWRFSRADSQPIMRWCELQELGSVTPPRRRHWFEEVRVAVDVQNPLLGPRGASRVYGPQKGLRPIELRHAEKCLSRLAKVMEMELGKDLASQPGAGAAGGLGFGLPAFLGARLEPGFELVAEHAGLERRLATADLVVTGEGSLDASTLMGKGVGQLARRCRSLRIPCIALAGSIGGAAPSNRLFQQVHALTELVDAAQAQSEAARWLEELAAQTASRISAAENTRAAGPANRVASKI